MDQTSWKEELRCAWLISKWAAPKLLGLTACVAAVEVWLTVAAVWR